VAKTCPSCGYNSIGPFTDNCPICAEPVRNVRSDGAGRGGGWGNKRWIGGAALAGVLAVLWCCGGQIWQLSIGGLNMKKAMEDAKAKIEADRKARTVVVTAADLVKEFDNDADAAERKYKGKCPQVTGVVERTGKDPAGIPFAILHGGDEKAPIKIECFFDFWLDENPRTQKLPDLGQAVTVHGEYFGRVSHVQIRQCVVMR
jgi:hypothetical protein